MHCRQRPGCPAKARSIPEIFVGMQFIEKAAGGVALLLAVLVGFTLAKLTWRVLYAPAAVVPVAAAAPKTTRAATARRPAYAGLSGLHLFGQVRRSAPQVPLAVATAPATNLRLTLKGIFHSDSAGLNVAIIADRSGNERPYRAGDEVPGNAKITAILPHRVLLKRGGRLEALDLPRGDLERVAGREGSTEAGNDAHSGWIPRALAGNPVRITRYVMFAPITVDGRVKGYRVIPRGDNEVFRHSGLRKGDVVVRINGKAVGDQEVLGSVIQGLANADHVNLAVENGGETRRLDVRFE
jgi:general secretion pathway protein C